MKSKNKKSNTTNEHEDKCVADKSNNMTDHPRQLPKLCKKICSTNHQE